MIFARRLLYLLLPLAVFFYAFDDGPTLVRRYLTMARHVQAYWATTTDIQGAAGVTSMNVRATGALPADFSAFLRENRRAGARDFPPDVDAWGTPYELVVLGEAYEIISCGADKRCDTPYDNLVERLKMVKPPPKGEGDARLEKALKQALE